MGNLKEIRTFRDLIVWQKSMSMVSEIYRLSKVFPKEELYGLTSQMRRCAVSIPSNIAEGYGRKSTKDYMRFLRMSMGSTYELQTQVEISIMLEYVKKSDFGHIFELTREIERMLSSLIKKLDVAKVKQ